MCNNYEAFLLTNFFKLHLCILYIVYISKYFTGLQIINCKLSRTSYIFSNTRNQYCFVYFNTIYRITEMAYTFLGMHSHNLHTF
jgi:hypothetical protein